MEAEDVILDAAHHAGALARSAWTRNAARAEEARIAEARRRLEAWQAAWTGVAWPVRPLAPRAPAGFVGRLRRRPPWEIAPRPAAHGDGRGIWLPRPWLAADDEAARPGDAETPPGREIAQIAALVLARRLARGAVAIRGHPDAPRVRDLRDLLEGALADAALARDFPGLRGALTRVRRRARAQRPRLRDLRPRERTVERALRVLLDAPLDAPARALPVALRPESEAEEVTRAAGAWLAGLGEPEHLPASPVYRGVAPVPHWGTLSRAEALPAPAVASKTSGADRSRRSASLPRPLEPEAEPEAEGRPGPFVLAFSDAHLTVEAPGTARPPDTGQDEDPEALAEELARQERLPRVRREGEVREVIEHGAARSVAPAPGALRDASPSAWLYPEWDARAGGYRIPGSRVREVAPEEGASARGRLAGSGPFAADRERLLARRLRRQLESLRPARERLRRQPEGDALDLRALVEDFAARRAGRAGDGRLYTRERARRRDLAVTLLLDASSSTEAPVRDARRVIDVVKQTARAFSEALGAVGDRHAVLAFSSRGAEDVRVHPLKRFREVPGSALRGRIAALEPDGFTRLGAAIRHATAGLAREPARLRLLLLLSDAKPQDEDGYEGRYGEEDLRRAVAEARRQQVHPFAVVVGREDEAKDLARLFGPHGYARVDDPLLLAERLPALYRRLTADA